LTSGRRAGVKTVGLLAALTVGLGVLTAAAALPLVGATGVAMRDVAKTWLNLPVAGLGQVPGRSVLLDTSGQPIAYYYSGPTYQGRPHPIFRDPVTWAQTAPVVRNAIVAVEDYRFWQHGALDVRGTIRALFSTSSGSGVQGGSDIAQQYVKNACSLTAPTYAAALQCRIDSVSIAGLVRKLKELRIASNVQRSMTRPQLLTAYLNAAYFGNGAYGIKVASQFYFSVPPSRLSLPQAATLAGVVNDPYTDDPVAFPGNAIARRNLVLSEMALHGYISQATANRVSREPLGLHTSPIAIQAGCTAQNAAWAAFFCDYVLAVMRHDPQYAQAYSELTTVGGLKIYTTLNAKDQLAADHAVHYVLPGRNGYYNPNHDVDAEVLIQPGTGQVRAIAVNRPYGFDYAAGQTSLDYAVNSPYNGGVGVQTGSSSKLFTLVTALKQGLTYSYHLRVHSGMTTGASTDCHGAPVPAYPVANADPAEAGNWPLYAATAASVNAYFVTLEGKIGLCNVVKTAVSMGMTRADGLSLLKRDPSLGRNGLPADDLASFTLGSVYVSPMSMAAAYATVASRGVYCHPIAITAITDAHGKSLPVESAGCHRVLSKGVADATNYALENVLVAGTAFNRGIGRPAAAKTGTANGGYYAAFAGYTPTLVGYVSVFNPANPTGAGAMVGCPQSDYRELNTNYPTCPGQMYGDNAPGATWQFTFFHAALGPRLRFPYPPLYFGPGTGTHVAAPPKKKKGGPGPSPSPSPPGHH
jgi:membrane peptidoglycan carboxypeptidase